MKSHSQRSTQKAKLQTKICKQYEKYRFKGGATIKVAVKCVQLALGEQAEYLGFKINETNIKRWLKKRNPNGEVSHENGNRKCVKHIPIDDVLLKALIIENSVNGRINRIKIFRSYHECKHRDGELNEDQFTQFCVGRFQLLSYATLTRRINEIIEQHPNLLEANKAE